MGYGGDREAPIHVATVYYSAIGVSADCGGTIRYTTRGEQSLDDVMTEMYARFGKTGSPFSYDELIEIVNVTAGLPLTETFSRCVAGVEPLPLDTVLGWAGVREQRSPLRVRLKLADDPADRALLEAILSRR